MATTQCILSEYLQHAMAKATYDKLEDGAYVGKIPECTGVIAFGGALRDCEKSLQSVLEDWLLRNRNFSQNLKEGSPKSGESYI